jgi:hypothetical protein
MFFSSSKKQSITCLSSTESELYCAVEATKEIIFFRDLLDEIGFPQINPTTLYVDNKSLIAIATKYSGSTKRVKHFMGRVNFMIEQVGNHVVHLEYLQTANHPADALSKPLDKGPLEKHRRMQLGLQI